MNRIILIGNGFDLAHKLETSYKHFIDWFWEDFATASQENSGRKYENDVIVADPNVMCYSQSGNTNYLNLLLNLKKGTVKIGYKNRFFKTITDKAFLKDWVDIEEEYYQQIKNIVQGKPHPYEKEEKPIIKLNEEFEKIKEKLEKYLSEITSKDIGKIEGMSHLFYDGFELEDFPKSKENLLIEYAADILNDSNKNEKCYSKELKTNVDERFKQRFFATTITTKERIIECIKELNKNDSFLNSVNRIYPQNTLILNFNYTKTETNYVVQNKPIHSIHIHGDLNNKDNSIIFGYGDELADEYKEIEKMKDNDYFKNIKSINYLKTGNYRTLLNFIDSDCYQIFILGHSCGNSDRTLLNTLFEHKNCVSIKPFFYEKERDMEKTDDYEDIIINISRNFNDKKAFREKVVDRTRCSSLPQMQK